MAEILVIAFLAGGLCAFVFLFLLSWMGIYAGLLPFLQISQANPTNWYEVILWIGSAAVGVLVFTRMFRSGVKVLPRKPESRFTAIGGSPPSFPAAVITASVIAVIAGGVAFCVSIYLSACIGIWTGLIEFRFFEPYHAPDRYESLMWIWSIGLGVVVFWIVYRHILITSHHIQRTARGESRGAVSE